MMSALNFVKLIAEREKKIVVCVYDCPVRFEGDRSKRFAYRVTLRCRIAGPLSKERSSKRSTYSLVLVATTIDKFRDVDSKF